MPRERRKKEEHQIETAGMMRWLLTYADLITLLLAMFITLYAASHVDIQRFKKIAAAFQEALGIGGQVVLKGGTSVLNNPGGPPKVKPNIIPFPYKPEPEIKKVAGELGKYIKEKRLTGKVRLELEERGLRISLVTDEVLFDLGKADLKPEAKTILNKISQTLMNISNHIRIEGHTCNLPISTPEFPSNWELSTRRATNVLRYLIQTGMPTRRVSAAGYADTRPLKPNVNEANRRYNRRVDIIILKSEEGKLEPKGRI